MLPNISLNSPVNSSDVNKQISVVRSQMASLKEAIEDELQHISYDQLDASLRKKIDSISELYSSSIEQTDILAETIQAKYLTAQEIAASYATFGTVDAVSARVSAIEADYITTTALTTTYLNADYISALGIKVSSANITGKLTASQIEASSFSGTYFEGNEMSFDTVDTDKINNTGNIHTGSIGITNGWFGDIVHSLTSSKAVIGGTSTAVSIKGKTVSWKYDANYSGYVLIGN